MHDVSVVYVDELFCQAQKVSEEVFNLVCAQVNSAFYPQWDGKCSVAYYY